MRSTRLEKTLTDMIRPQVQGLGYVLWGLTAPSAGHRTVVSLYIEKEGGVTVDDCARVSRDVAALLDVEDPIPGGYTLEVSSPGLERRFFEPDQLTAYMGRTLAVKLDPPQNGRRNITGELLAADGEGFELKTGETQERIGFGDVKSVCLVHEF